MIKKGHQGKTQGENFDMSVPEIDHQCPNRNIYIYIYIYIY